MSNELFVFPDVLPYLDYADRIPLEARRPMAVDARLVIERYTRVMSSGMQYQEFIESPVNQQRPNEILRENVSATKFVNAQGWSWDHAEALVGATVPELLDIPPDCNTLETRAFDEVCARALTRVARTRGFLIANSTKLLHQKRPAAIPILDSYSRIVLGVHWIRGDGDGPNRRAFELGFKSVRQAWKHPGNQDVLRRCADVYAERIGRAAPSMIRIIDILAWGAHEGAFLQPVVGPTRVDG